MTQYYDVVLGVIPLALIGITGVVVAFGLSVTSGVMFGSVISIGVIGHAMFVNGPTTETSETRSHTPSQGHSNAGGMQAPNAD